MAGMVADPQGEILLTTLVGVACGADDWESGTSLSNLAIFRTSPTTVVPPSITRRPAVSWQP